MSLALLHEVLHLERPLIGVDLETTGTEAKTSAICELALEIMAPGRPVKEYRTLVRPLIPIPAEATAIHGITYDMVKDAPTFLQLADNLIKGFQGCDFAGYNLFFDLEQLAEEFRRAGKVWDYEGARVIDGYRLWQLAETRKLEDAVERWLTSRSLTEGQRAELDALLVDGQAHNALWDIKMSTRVIAAQLLENNAWPRDVQQLHELQWPGRFDALGKLRWHKDGYLFFTFGAHRNVMLQRVPKSYLKWVVGADFSERVKRVCQDAIDNRYPSPPAKPIEDADDEALEA